MGKDKKKDSKKDRKKDKTHKKDKKRRHSSSSSSSSESKKQKKLKKQKKVSHSRSRNQKQPIINEDIKNIQKPQIQNIEEKEPLQKTQENNVAIEKQIINQNNDQNVIPEVKEIQQIANLPHDVVQLQNTTIEEQNQIGNEIVEENFEDEEREKKINLELLKRFGFTTLGTTKGKDHTASAVEGVFKAANAKRKYRQYMHRRGGFNRLLDKME